LPTKNGNGTDNIAGALAEISDRLTRLVQDEIELAKAEVTQKAMSLVRGTAALAAGAVFGIFAVVFLLLTLAWVFDGIFVSGAGSLWLGFLIVLVILLLLTVGAALFAWRAFSVGAPTPTMAIDEGKKIKDTVTSFGGPANGKANAPASATDYPSRSFAAVAGPAAAAAAVIEPGAQPAGAVTSTMPAPLPVSEPEPPIAVQPPASEPAGLEPVVLEPAATPAEPTPAEPTPAEATPAEPTPAEPTPAEATPEEPTFVSVPEPAPTENQPTAPGDAPTLIAHQGTPEAPADDEPANEIKPVHEDDDSTGAEK
jgi:hypothetical protein